MTQKIGKSSWRVQYREYKPGKDFGKIKSACFSRKEDAKTFEDKIKRERSLMKRGLELPHEEILFLDYVRMWLTKRAQEVIQEKRAAGSFEMDECRLNNHVIPYFGALPIAAITTKMIREFLDELQKKQAIKDSTRNRYRALLHSLFQDAYFDEKIVMNPVARIQLLEERPIRKPCLTSPEIEIFLQACYAKNPIYGFCATLMIFEGRRVSEAVAVKNKDFDLERDELYIGRIFEKSTGLIQNRIKGKPQGLVIPLFPRVKQAFLEHLQMTPFKNPDDFCIYTTDGQSIGTHSMTHHIQEISFRIFKKKISSHILRATFATLAEEAGFSKEDIQRMLGHSTVLVTERYTRRSAQPLVEKAKQLRFGEEREVKNVIPFKKGNTV